MKDLESELMKIPLREPSSDLDERVLSQRPLQRSPRRTSHVPGRIRWVIAWSLASCLIGFFLGRVSISHPTEDAKKGAKHTRLAATFVFPTERNPFDATVPTEHFLTQKWIVTTSSKERNR